MENVDRITIDSFIGYYEGIASNELCDSIIRHYDAESFWKPSTYAGHGGVIADSDARVKMDQLWITEDLPFYSELHECFSNIAARYRKEHPDFMVERVTAYRLNRYDAPNGFMSRHADNIHHSHGQEYGFPLASSLLFLNDDYKGGELILCDGVFCRKPAKGSGIIFPSNFMFPHEVRRVEEGSRYSVVTWLI